MARPPIRQLLSTLFTLGLVSLGSVGCGGDPPRALSEPDAGLLENEELPPAILVAGTVEIHPDAKAWLEAGGHAVPEVNGLLTKVEEPFRVATGEAEGSFGESRLDAAGAFSVATVNPGEIRFGVAATVSDDQPDPNPRVTRAGSLLYDPLLENGRPQFDLHDLKSWALPVAFTEMLETAITQAAIQTISGQPDLATAGFMLGKIVDEAGQPVAGATVVLDEAGYAGNVFYPAADFLGANQTGTSSNGLFVYVKSSAGTTDTFTFTVKDKPEYLKRNGGAAKEAGLILDVFPGR